MSMMEPKQISQRWTVFEILQMFPEVSQVFLRKKTSCVGCYMARFCTLKDVANVYSLEPETLVHEIQQASIKNTNQNSKE
jgi:hybrid cluster-associated redox disulfide protein